MDDFRGDFMLSTCIAILAVDFGVFPARFPKSETYGTSVMDVGPGGIIFAGGLVSGLSPSTYIPMSAWLPALIDLLFGGDR